MSLPLPRGRLKPSQTVRFTLDNVFIPPENPAPVTLILKYAGRSNAAFFNASAKEPAASGAGTAADQANASDLRMASLFARHVIEGWEGVGLADAPIAYTHDGGEELLRWLIAEEQRADVFRAVQFVASDADRFRPKQVDPVDVGKP